MAGNERPGKGLLVVGFFLAAASLVLGPLTAIPAIAIGVLIIVRGQTGAGATMIVLAVALPILTVVVLFGVWKAHAYRTPSGSMEPTLSVGDRLLTTDDSNPSRGDILVFHPPRGAEVNECGLPGFNPEERRQACPRPTRERSSVNFIKRVVAVGGDRLSVKGGRVYIDGQLQKEPFIRPSADCGLCRLERPITIPDGDVFMVGDNRGESADSREWGPVPEEWVVGKVRLRYWPLSAFGSP